MNIKQILFIFTIVVLVCATQSISVGGNVDANGDGVVNTKDLEFVDAHLGRIGNHPADVNDDNVVNIVDLMLVKNAIGTRTTPPPRGDVGGMVLIPAGTFQMGSNNGNGDERPVHTVHVDAFYMDTHEVTNAEYKKFIDANPQWQKERIEDLVFQIGISGYLAHWNGNDYPVGKGDHPVWNVSWHAAVAYSQWAGKRLPTEAEWEKAARGGLVGKKYPWGDTIDGAKVTWGGPWITNSTRPVGSYPPNGYGLYDMSGNVAEWCLDEYQSDFYSRSPHQNPIAGATSIQQVLDNYRTIGKYPLHVHRGGHCNSLFLHGLRVAHRGTYHQNSTSDRFGFRCARSR